MNPITFKGNTQFNVLYFSDVHAKTNHLSSFKTAVDTFEKENKGQNNLKLAGGDLNMDTALKPNSFILKMMNLIGLDATCVGNHDLEGGSFWADAIEKAKPKFKILSANLEFLKPNKLENKIAKSTIIKKNGNKVGIIGVSPLDYEKLSFHSTFNDFATVQNFDKTVKSVKSEVKELEKKGIDKIFLLAHTGLKSAEGLNYYKKLAEIGGIDVIIGGHDHKEFNFWHKTDRDEPVKIVSVGSADDKNVIGEDLDTFGVLKAIFDEKGVLIPEKTKSQVEITDSYPVNKEIAELEEKYLKNNKVIAKVAKDIKCLNKYTEENPVGSLLADAMLWLVNKDTKGKKAQLALVNSGTIRGEFSKGDLTLGMLRQALPFTSSTLIKTTLNKKQLLDTLNWCAKSTELAKISPGIMQVSGIKYEIDAENKVTDVYLLNEDGSISQDLKELPDDYEMTVVYDEFLATGVAGLTAMKKNKNDQSIEHFSDSNQSALLKYIESNFKDKPVEVTTGRILVNMRQKVAV